MKQPATPAGSREEGSQLFELAIALPILFLLVVGVWDLGAGFALKQKLTNAAREAARITAGVPTNFVDTSGNPCSPAPCNIQAAVNSAVQYMNNAGLNASCLTSASPTFSAAQNGWTYSCNGITLEIDRGNGVAGPSTPVTLPDGRVVSVPITQVGLVYPITWTAGQLLPPPVPPQARTQVKMQNLAP
ncbi:MAG TPA: TadE family protein [Candidatus Acidoferrales bacterium]|nr:TadE family protein [Candidatus Acidoferrales bacterium]